MKIGIILREISYLKCLYPAIVALPNAYLFIMDCPKGDKEYDRPTINKIKSILPKAKNQIIAFDSDKKLYSLLISNKINKIISLEIGLWGKSYLPELHKANIQTHSISYLTDSLWQTSAKTISNLDHIYYCSEWLRDMALNFAGAPYNSKRDHIASPMFDIIKEEKSNNKVLVLLPNLKQDQIKSAFGNQESFNKIINKIESFAGKENIIYKARQKQWVPDYLKNKVIVDNLLEPYPPIITEIFKQTTTTICFYSSGVYESVLAGNYIINIKLPLDRWNWNKDKLKEYFSDAQNSLYNWNGAVKSYDQPTILQPNFAFISEPEPDARKKWLNHYIGKQPENATDAIIKNILF
jgi:hypothetical protein